MAVRSSLLIAAGALLLTSVLAPADAQAQRVAVHAHAAPHHAVVVGGGYYYGGPRFYGSFYAGYPWYGGYYGFGYGYGYPYAYPAYGYPYPYYDPDASMRLVVTPRQTEVFVDGYYAGTVDDFDGTFQRLNLEPGEHEVQLFLPGHRSVLQRVYLQRGKTAKVKLAMTPLGPGEPEPVKPTAPPAQPITPRPSPSSGAPSYRPAPGPSGNPGDGSVSASPAIRSDGYGSVAVRVQPGPAIVTIDGERWEGPQGNERFVVELPTGRHVIDVQKDGYRQYTTEVTVKPGETAALNVVLSKN